MSWWIHWRKALPPFLPKRPANVKKLQPPGIRSWTNKLTFRRILSWSHAISPASYYALYQKFDQDNFILNPDNDLHSYKVVASSMKAMYPESQYTKAILNHLDQINKAIQNMKIKQLINNSEGHCRKSIFRMHRGTPLPLVRWKGNIYCSILLSWTAKTESAIFKKWKRSTTNLKTGEFRFIRFVWIRQTCLAKSRKTVGYQLDLCLGSGWFEKPCCSDVEHTTCTCQLYYQP